MVCRYDEPVDRYFVSDHCYEVAFMLRRPWHHPDYPIYSLALPPEEAIARLHRACREDILLMPTLWGCRALEKYVLPSAFDGFFSDALARAIWAGDVAIIRLEREWRGRLPPLPGELPGPGAGTGPGPQPKTDTWFDLTVIDEMGVPIPGVELLFSFDQQVHVTDRDGRIELRGLPPQFHQTRVRTPPPAATPPSGEPQPLDSLRAAVKPRWDQVRLGPRYELQTGDVVVPLHGETPIDISLLSERPGTIVVVPWVVRVRLIGGYFDTNKCFLLPTAVKAPAGGQSDLQKVRQHIADNPHSALLLVGHTDTTGEPEYNDAVSLERAEAVAAYLRHDVDAWLAWYGTGKPAEKRWGPQEDHLMLSQLSDHGSRPEGEVETRWFQRTRRIQVDGDAGPETRRALIAEYMAASDTTPPEGVDPTTHGCGESFPLPERVQAGADSADAPDSMAHVRRRVELYAFDRVLGVEPRPAGAISPADSQQYPEWVRRSRATYDYEAAIWPDILVLEWPDDLIERLPPELELVATWRDRAATLKASEAIKLDGYVRFVFEGVRYDDQSTLVARTAERDLVLWEQQRASDPRSPPQWRSLLSALLPEPNVTTLHAFLREVAI